MKTLLKILGSIVGVVVLLALGFFAFAEVQHWRPPETLAIAPECPPGAPALKLGDELTVVSWNLQYGASRAYHFFYDGGPDVVAEPEVVQATTAAIRDGLAAMGTDLALLQEVDRDSHRTHNIDQLPTYASFLDTRCTATATYYKSAFVPTPAPDFMGSVHMDLALVSRFRFDKVVRTQLAVLDEPRLRQAFNLKRALMTAELPIEGSDQPLAIGNTHLSAFSFGDGTSQKQVAVLEQWMASRPPDQPWILAGDMNLLPPGDDPSRLKMESELYDAANNAIEKLFPRFQDVAGATVEEVSRPEFRTYLYFGAREPDRKIDWFFYGGPITLVEAQVHREYDQLSDHLPIRAVFRIGPEPEPEPEPSLDEAPADEAPEDEAG